MRLFIEDEPFAEELDPEEQSIRRVEIRLKVAITEPMVAAPPQEVKPLEFVLDTASDYATVFPNDLWTSGLSVAGPSGGWVTIILWDGSGIKRPMRDVTLWLYSNLPSFENQAHRIDLNGGVVVLKVPDPDVANLVKPVLGMNALLDAGVQIKLDCRAKHFSVWIPE